MNEINLSHIDLNLLVVFEVLMREGNVTRAAAHLGRTQSAVSHSLGRLREQLGDPLMIKSGGRMCPTPFAQRLAEDIRPLLRNIERVIAPPEPFDSKSSQRIFRIAFPAASSAFMAGVMERVGKDAPGVCVEWLTPNDDAFAALAAGSIDIAEIGGKVAIPDGIETHDGPPQTWMTYARKNHPAVKKWGIDAWEKWPHIKLKVATTVVSPVEDIAQGDGPKRRIGAWVSNISGVLPLLARTDMLATFPPILAGAGLKQLGLCALEPPLPIAAMPMRFLWSFRLTNDPGSKWFREIVMEVFKDQVKKGERSILEVGVIKAKKTRRKSRA